jgi:ribosome-binding protein aMBF1 (putative translation factor)
LGIEQRQIHAKRIPDSGITRHRKPFPTEIKTFGDALRKARGELGMKQSELAAKAGISQKRIKRWENDKAIPSDAECRFLSAVLGNELLPFSVIAVEPNS